MAGVSSLGVLGVPWHPLILADQLNLSQGGKLCPPNNTGTPGFSNLPTALNSVEAKIQQIRQVILFSVFSGKQNHATGYLIVK